MGEQKKIYLSPPHLSGQEAAYMEEAIRSNWIAPVGPDVDAFEEETKALVGVKGAVAVSSGTAAIHLALSLLNIKPNDTVFCSTLTFVASANHILYLGATPVFIDSEPETWNMSPLALRRALNEASLKGKLPKAVIVVHLFGQSAKMDEIRLICNYYDIPVIEDAAESMGSTYKGKASGTLGDFGIYSFNGNKIITTSGGGMLVSDDEKAIEKARFLATQAKEPAPYYQHKVAGYNYRMSNLLAAFGRAQLKVLHDRVQARRRIFDRYCQTLIDLPGLSFMPEMAKTKSNRWLTALTVKEELAGLSSWKLLEVLQQEEIEARLVWKPLHLQPLFNQLAYYPHDDEDQHVAAQLFQTGICLPSGSSLTTEQQDRVIAVIRSAFHHVNQKRYFILGKPGVYE